MVKLKSKKTLTNELRKKKGTGIELKNKTCKKL